MMKLSANNPVIMRIRIRVAKVPGILKVGIFHMNYAYTVRQKKYISIGFRPDTFLPHVGIW